MSPRIETNAPVFADSSCPSEEGLRELLEGRPDASDQASLVGHLDECAICRDRLQSLAANNDLWSRAARNLRESAADEYGELTSLMARLQTRILGPDDTLAPFQPGPAADFLRPCSTPGRLGCLGPYEIVELLGRGGMGVVYKAIDPALDRTVAIKVLACAPSFSADARARFRREARAAAAVRSVYAVAIHAVEETAESPYLVMEYVDGHSLQEQLDRNGPLEIDEILRIGSQTARGLAGAHTQGLIHRDVKPANILLETGTGMVKITDFGLAKAIDAPSLTQAGTVTGTPEYMAPEQTSDGPIDHRADLFSVGSVLYATCTGRPPFRAERSLAVLRRTREETPVPIRQLRPDVPDALIEIIDKLHRKDPNDRYASAAEVADALEQLRTVGQAADYPTPLSRFGRGAGGEGTLCRRVRWALLAASLVLVVALSASELAGLTGIASWAVSRMRETISQDAPTSSVDSGETALAVPRATDREPMLLAAAPPADAKKPASATAPVDDNRPQQITSLRRLEGHTGPVWGVAVSPDGKRLVSCSGHPQGDCTVRLWDVATGKEIRRLHADQLLLRRETKKEDLGVPGEVYAVAFAPDGRRVAFVGAAGLAALWDADTDSVIRRYEGHETSVYSATFSPDGKQMLTGGADGTGRLWDVETGKELQRLSAHTGWVRGVAISPDGRQALTGGTTDRTMRLWDLGKGEQVREFKEQTSWVWSVAFTRDGRQAISGAQGVHLWDLSDGRLLRTFDSQKYAAIVAVSPDGRRILSGGYLPTVRLWDRTTGREIATLAGHWNWVRSVAFSPDGRHAFTASGGTGAAPPWQPGNDFAIRVWKLP